MMSDEKGEGSNGSISCCAQLVLLAPAQLVFACLLSLFEPHLQLFNLLPMLLQPGMLLKQHVTSG